MRGIRFEPIYQTDEWNTSRTRLSHNFLKSPPKLPLKYFLPQTLKERRSLWSLFLSNQYLVDGGEKVFWVDSLAAGGFVDRLVHDLWVGYFAYHSCELFEGDLVGVWEGVESGPCCFIIMDLESEVFRTVCWSLLYMKYFRKVYKNILKEINATIHQMSLFFFHLSGQLS